MLKRLYLDFVCESPAVDEQRYQHEAINTYVVRLAVEKANRIAEHHQNAIIIGSDQALQCGESILGKPGDHKHAIEQLRQISGKSITFYTGLCVINTKTQSLEKDVIPFHVHFRELSEVEIENYLQKEKPYQCAGSFMSEQLGISLVSSMRGDDPSALIGLPLIRLCEMLRKQEISI